MSEPTMLFAAVRDAEGTPADTIQFQINPDSLQSADEAAFWIHNLRLHIAQALTEFGKSSDNLMAWQDIMTAEGQEVDKMIAAAQAADSFKVEF